MTTTEQRFVKGQTVFYVAAQGAGVIVRAKVVTLHRDGGALVEARDFYIGEGKFTTTYLGFKYELAADQIHPNAAAAESYRAGKLAATR